MVLDSIGNALKKSIDKISSAIFVDKSLIDSIVKDLQRALITADVNIKLVKEISEKVRDLGQKNIKGVEKKEQLIKLLNDEIISILGGERKTLELDKKETILFVGLYGTGKTTTISKIATYYKKRGRKIALLGLDVHRPAAPEQLEQLGEKITVDTFIDKEEKDPIKIYKTHKKQLEKYDLVLVDSAGRDALEDTLIKEISDISKIVKPTQTILVIAADIGQAAKTQVEAFQKATNISGVIVTRMDSSAKAGGALSACAITEAPIKFIGVGEKLEDLESFNPEGFVGRLLGMGDLTALLEKAQGAISEEDAEDLSKRLLKGEFTLIDLFEQMEAMSKMGPLSKVVEMIPGFSQIKLPKEALQGQEGKLEKWKHAMQSMTKAELENPDEIMTTERIERISKGSGVAISDIRGLMKQYRQGKKLVKMMKGSGDVNKIMKKMQGKMPKGF